MEHMKTAEQLLNDIAGRPEKEAQKPLETDSRFWDCECDTQFIHRRELHLICEECGKYDPKALCPCVYDRGFDVDVEPAIRNSNAEVNNAA